MFISSLKKNIFSRSFAVLAILLSNIAPVYALPQNGTVVGGSATITTPSATQLNVNQSTSRAIINWNSFDINTGEQVNFVQPSSQSITLNRVTGGGSASQILGQLNANGNVWIVNPQGVLIGQGAQVNVGGLIATSSDIDNNNFMNGNYVFNTPGDPNATISNAGDIKVADGSLAALVGPNVTNSGLIAAKLGKVELASGDTFTVDLYGDGLLNLQASPQLTKQLVANSGKIEANGGEVLLTAAAAETTINSLINMSGVIEANSIGNKDGHVVLYAAGSNAVAGNVAANKGTASGSSTVEVSGTINAKGKKSGQTGGTIAILGDNVILTSALLNTSGAAGGGTIKVGGAMHGAGDTPTALNTTVDSNTVLLANATQNGNGGNVTVWSDGSTDFAGTIKATGGANGGNGGFVETSGALLNATGMVYTSATNGLSGTWLLDPDSVTIVTSGSVTDTCTSGTCTPTGATSSLQNTILDAALVNGNVDVTTGAGSGTSGSITVSAPVTWNTSNTLTLTSAGNIVINNYGTISTSGATAGLTLNAGTDIDISNSASITASSGKLNVILNADTAGTGGSILIGPSVNIATNGGNITLEGGSGGAAVGDAATNGAGVEIAGGTLNAQGGNISIAGNGSATVASNAYGVDLQNSALVETSGTGTITVVGNGGGNGSNASTNNYGVTLANGIITVSGNGGSISVTGVGGDNVSAGKSSADSGINISSPGSAISSTGNASITLTGTAGGAGATASSDFGIANIADTIGGASATGQITLIANSYNLYAGSTLAQTTGNVTFLPLTTGTSIGVAGGAGTLQLTSGTNSILGSVNAGSITIGSTNDTAALTANANTWSVSVSLLDGSGNIDINGAQTMGTHTFLADTAMGNIVISANGSVTSTATGDAIILAASGGAFENGNGSSALSDSNGNWLVYSSSPTASGENFNNLNSNNTAVWDTTYPTAVSSSLGNRYVFAMQPTLTIAAANLTKTYGEDYTTQVAGDTYTVSGLQAGVSGAYLADTFSGTVTLSSLGSATTAGVVGSPYAIAANVAGGNNGYAVTTTGAVTVNPATLMVTADNQSMVYGANGLPTFTDSVTGFVNGEGSAVVSGAAANSTTATAYNNGTAGSASNVGSYSITPTLGTLSASNYTFAFASGTLTVTPASFTALSGTKTYDGTTGFTGVTLNGVDGETFTVASANSNSANASSNSNNPSVNFVSASGITGNAGALTSNYTALNLTSLASNTATIDTASFTAISGTKTYDGTTDFTNVTLTGVNGETFNVASAQSNSANASSNPVNPSTDFVSASGITGASVGADPGNYAALNLASLASKENIATITPAALTITANDQGQTYGDGNNFTAGFTPTGLQNNETVGSVSLATDATTSTSGNWNAGTWTITASNATGGTFDIANYAVNYVNGALNIAQKALTIAATGVGKVYDSTTAAQVILNQSGLIANDLVTLNYANANFASPHAANGIAVTANVSISGTDAHDYISNTTVSTTANITPATIILTGTKTYDDTTAFNSSAFGTSGVIATGINGETLDITGVGSVANANVSAGKQNLTTGTLALANGTGLASDYQIATTGNTGTITAATITLTGTKTYDSNTTFAATDFGTFGIISTGIAGQTLDLSGSGSVSSPNVNAGSQSLTVGSLKLNNGFGFNSGLASNYTIATSGNTGTITPATLTYNANLATMTYGASVPTLSGTVTGFVNGQNLGNATTGTLTWSTTASSSANVGTYAIDGSGLTADNGNYKFVQGFANPFAMSITPAIITLVGTKTYDGTTTFAADDFGADGTVDGVNGQTLTLTGSGSVLSPNVVSGTQFLLTGSLKLNGTGGSLASNYQISFIGNTGTITPAALTASIIGDPTKVYDGTEVATLTSANYLLTGFVGSQGATVTQTVGTYNSPNVADATTVTANITGDLTANKGTLLSNYILPTSASGDGKITPATLTVTPDGVSTVYNATTLNNTLYSDNTGNYSITGFVNSETVNSAGIVLNGSLAFNGSTTTPVLHAGTYTQDQGTLALSSNYGNYVMTFTNPVPNNYVITPAALQVSANNQAMPLGGPVPTLTFDVSGLQGSDSIGTVFTGALATNAVNHSLPGIYNITQGTLAADPDYTIASFTPGFLLVASPFVSADAIEELLHPHVAKGGPIGTLLAIATLIPPGGIPPVTGPLANLAPAAGGTPPVNFANLTPEELSNLAPAAGGPNGGSYSGVVSLIECNASAPCGLSQ